MTAAAVLLLDLQRDFLATDGARMPVGPAQAARLIQAANAVLDGQALSGALPIAVVNQFPRSAWLANFFRHGAAIAGTAGAAIDPRVRLPARVRIFPKQASSAFTNPALASYLQANGIARLYVMGVFAEGCVRATAVDAVRRGYEVRVPTVAIGTDSEIKRRFALWAMARGGVELVPSLPDRAT